MSDQLDNDLKNRIREVFDNYQDDTADAGWLLLREKFPEEKKRRIVAWWWYSAAAVLLLCLGTWFFYPQASQPVASQFKKGSNLPDLKHQGDNTRQMAGHKPAPAVNSGTANTAVVQNEAALNRRGAQTASSQLSSPTVTSSTASPNQAIATAQQPAVNNAATSNLPSTLNTTNALSTAKVAQPSIKTETISIAQPTTNAAAQTQAMAKVKQPLKPSGQVTGATLANSAFNINKQSAAAAQMQVMAKQPLKPSGQVTGATLATSTFDINKQGIAKVKQPALSNNAVATVAVTDSNAVAKATQPMQVATAPAPAAKAKEDAVLNMIKADDARQVLNKKQDKKQDAKTNGSRMLSVYAATYFNYAKGSENQVNVGAGFTSDFKISNNLKFSTGLSIAQNKLNYSNDNLPAQINNKVAVAAATADGLRTNILSSSVVAIQTTPTPRNYNASLVGLDLPLNFKYQFNPQKSDTYISAGISSGTYINETYRSTYSYGGSNNGSANSATSFGLANNSTASQSQETTTNQHFSTFDFAKTLNFSFGIGYPIGNSRLIIEPFIKYPLGGLGAQNISFGSSGINLKLNFRTTKSK